MSVPTQAPAGGATSPLNGEFYKGGQFMCNQFAMPKGYARQLRKAANRRTDKTENIATITVSMAASQWVVLIRMAGDQRQDNVFSGTRVQCVEFANKLIEAKAENRVRAGLVAHPTELVFAADNL